MELTTTADVLDPAAGAPQSRTLSLIDGGNVDVPLQSGPGRQRRPDRCPARLQSTTGGAALNVVAEAMQRDRHVAPHEPPL